MNKKNGDLVLFWLIVFVAVLNSLKIWLFYFLGIDHALVTAVSFTALGLGIFIRYGFGLLTGHVLVLINIVLVQLSYSFIASILKGDFSDFVAASYYFLRFFIFFSVVQFLSNPCYRRKILVFFGVILIISFVHNVMVHPSLLDMSFLEVGGNIFSANNMGISRVNGLVGGTVIDYSCILCAIMVVLYSSEAFRYKQGLTVVLILNVLMNFSRAAIIPLCVILMFRKSAWSGVIRFILLSGAIFVLFNDPIGLLTEVISIYQDAFSGSDDLRVAQWSNSMENPLSLVFGNGAGQTTGLLLGDSRKVVSDSFLMGMIFDSGLLVTGYFCFVVYNCIKTALNATNWYLFLFAFALPLAVNSGFEKMLVALVHGMALSYCCCVSAKGNGEIVPIVRNSP